MKREMTYLSSGLASTPVVSSVKTRMEAEQRQGHWGPLGKTLNCIAVASQFMR